MQAQKSIKPYLLVLTICVVSITLRLGMLDSRWINPDEGAHLMDGVLILDGQTPGVDFGSRQPLYAYTNAAALYLLGVDYTSGRILPVIFSVLTGWVIFLISLTLFDKNVATLSAAIYWFLPLELFNSLQIQTEPMVTFLISFSLCSVALYSSSRRFLWLIIAGIFAAMGFYVRESALIIFPTIIGFLLVYHRGQLRITGKCLGFFLTGYIAVISVAFIFYIRFMTLEDFLMGGHSPAGFLISAVKSLSSLLGSTSGTTSDVAYLAPDYFRNIISASIYYAFLLVGFFLSVIMFARQLGSKNTTQVPERLVSQSLLYLWLFSLLIAYTYYYYHRGFFINYSREFLPPLVIVFSVWLRYAVPSFDSEKVLTRFVLSTLLISAIIFTVVFYWGRGNERGSAVLYVSSVSFAFVYFAMIIKPSSRRLFWTSSVCLVVIALIALMAPLKPYRSGILAMLAIIGVVLLIPWFFSIDRARSLHAKTYVRFMTFLVVVGSFILSLIFDANTLSLKYHGLWSPVTLREVSSYLKMHTHTKDAVMSGGVIWELQAQRRPFLGISHPLGFERKISEEDREEIEAALKQHPPMSIVLDGYTEKTYLKQFPALWDLLSSRYRLVYIAERDIYPVRLYQLGKL